MPDGDHDVIIIGAGIQGACTALELARRGRRVLLLERDTLAMNRASLRNEGKVHLGLVYAADASMATAGLQLDGALTFWPLLRRWLGSALDGLAVSTPFHYLVAQDSLLDAGQLAGHYQRLQERYQDCLAGRADLDYLGSRPAQLFRPLSQHELRRHHPGPGVLAGFATAERAVSTEGLAGLLRAALAASERITLRTGHVVTGLQALAAGLQVDGLAHGRPFRLQAGQVVNAAWDGRLALDAQMGIAHSGWVYRLKYRVIARLPAGLQAAPSATMVLGPYGDVVIRPDGTAYLSWYPDLMRGWSHEPSPPEHWQDACAGRVSAQLFAELSSRAIAAIGAWYPALAGAEPLLVDAGIIVAHGQTDVDDPGSGLHARTRVGVTTQHGYHSLDGGKLTTAPMFALQAAERVDAGL